MNSKLLDSIIIFGCHWYANYRNASIKRPPRIDAPPF